MYVCSLLLAVLCLCVHHYNTLKILSLSALQKGLDCCVELTSNNNIWHRRYLFSDCHDLYGRWCLRWGKNQNPHLHFSLFT
ncbi:hypothetical protein KP509_13G013800 [Ceratopteris richardii]|uniref:Secreted protein n=1 Tax=Ceratopteris richardii TaxID=49495 RepID=A0A8T2TFH5_CERRI|nr:hypothetical protein KP509_13G013800 [Ceratopteris richardii]